MKGAPMPPTTIPDPTEPTDLDGSLRLDTIALDLDVKPTVVRGMARRGELPAFKVGNNWRVGRRDYLAWKADRARAAARRQRYTQGL